MGQLDLAGTKMIAKNKLQDKFLFCKNKEGKRNDKNESKRKMHII